jgi:hypothetical protein
MRYPSEDKFRVLRLASIAIMVIYLVYAMIVIYHGTAKAELGRVATPKEKAWMKHHGIESAPVDDKGVYFIRKGKRINL